jgi:hypothetical protein
MTRLTRRGQNSRSFSSLTKLFGSQAAPSSKKHRRQALALRKSLFQALEQRTVLSAVSWVGGSAIGMWAATGAAARCPAAATM